MDFSNDDRIARRGKLRFGFLDWQEINNPKNLNRNRWLVFIKIKNDQLKIADQQAKSKVRLL